MADGGSDESWLDRWRAGYRSKDATCLLALLVEDRESGEAKVGDLMPAHVMEAAKVACKAGDADLLRQLAGLVEKGVCGRRGVFDRVFVKACGGGHVGMVRELLALSGIAAVNVHAEGRYGREGGFTLACENGHVAVVRELLALTGEREVNVHEEFMGKPEVGFRLACGNGHVEVVRELLSLSGDREVDVHAGGSGDHEFGFITACRYGHDEVVRELLALTGGREVDVHAGRKGRPDLGFHRACTNGHVDVLRELLGLTGHRAIPLHTRLGAGQVAVQPAKDAVWAGTSTRRGRRCMVLLREAAGR